MPGALQRLTSEVVLDRENPWPGLATFHEGLHAFFHGRARATTKLFRLVERAPVTLLYGKSGLGKSSLINAGLLLELRKAGREYFPIVIRLKFPSPKGEESFPHDYLIQQVKECIAQALEEHQIDARRPDCEETLYEYFHNRDLDFWDKRNRPLEPVLIFDQFEEIFSLGKSDEEWKERSEYFLQELAALLQEIHTQPVLRRLEDPDVQSTCDFDKKNFRILLCLREDFLPNLTERDDVLKSALRQTMRLAEMTRDQALEAVLEPGGHLIGPEVAARIVDFVGSPRRAAEGARNHQPFSKSGVDPSILSLVCQQLNEERKERQRQSGKPERIEIEHLRKEHASKVIDRFYNESVAALPALRLFVENSLVTREGHRVALPEVDALHLESVRLEDIDFLVRDRRILIRETENGEPWLRVSHDRIAEVARKSRTERELETQRTAAERKQKEAEEKQQEAEKRQHESEMRERLTRRRLTQVIVLAGLVILAFGIAVVSYLRAEAERQLAQQAQLQIQHLQSDSDLYYAATLEKRGQGVMGLAYAWRAFQADHSNSCAAEWLFGHLLYSNWPSSISSPVPFASRLRTIQWSPVTNRYILASGPNKLALYDARLQPLQAANLSAIGNLTVNLTTAVFSPDENFIIGGFTDGSVRRWKTNELQGYSEIVSQPTDLAVNYLRFSPDGNALFVGYGGNLSGSPAARTFGRLVFLSTRDNWQTDVRAFSKIEDAGFSSDGKYLVTISGVYVEVWPVTSGNDLRSPLARFQLKSPSRCLAIGPNTPEFEGLLIVAVGVQDGTVHLLTFNPVIEQSVVDKIIPADSASVVSDVTNVVWLPDGTGVVAAFPDGSVVLAEWNDIAAGLRSKSRMPIKARPILGPGGPAVSKLAIDKIRKQILLGDARGTVRFLEFEPDQVPAFCKSTNDLEVSSRVLSMDLSLDGGMLLVANGDDQIHLLDIRPRNALPLLLRHQETVEDFVLCQKSGRILSLSAGMLTSWDPTAGAAGKPIPVSSVKHLAMDECGECVLCFPAAGSGRNSLIWDIKSNQCQSLRNVEGDISEVQYSPESGRLVTVDESGLSVWRLDRSKRNLVAIGNRPLRIKESDNENPSLLKRADAPLSKRTDPTIVRLSGSGDRLFAASGTDWRIWDLGDDRNSADFPGAEKSPVTAAQFSKDGSRLAIGTKNSIRVLTFVNGDSSDVKQKLIPSLAEIVELQFSEDGKTLAAASSDCRVHTFDSQTGHEAYEYLVQDKRVTMIRFSRDGQKLLTVAGDEVRLWDVRTAIELLPVLRHPETVRQVEWTADEKFVVTRFGEQIAVWQVGFDLPENEKGWTELGGLISAVSGYEIDPHEPPRKGLPAGCSIENIRHSKPTTAIVDWLANSDYLGQKISPEIHQSRTQYFEALLRSNSEGQVSRNRKEAEWLASGEPTFEAMLRQAN